MGASFALIAIWILLNKSPHLIYGPTTGQRLPATRGSVNMSYILRKLVMS
jgi:hypothetical protein